MNLLINIPEISARLIAERKATGHDRHDEVWDGVYVMAPDPGNLHESTTARLTTVLCLLIDFPGKGLVLGGGNVTDREHDWRQNFRCPDVAVYLNDNPAEDRESHWLGGPDFAVEMTSPGEEPRRKLDFYAAVKTRELLIIEPNPWRLQLYRHDGTALQSVGRVSQADLPDAPVLTSETTGIGISLVDGTTQPEILVTHAGTQQRWQFGTI